MEDKLHRLGEEGGYQEKDGSLKKDLLSSKEKAMRTEVGLRFVNKTWNVR